MQITRDDYLRIPAHKAPEFWNAERIAHLRALATTGTASPDWHRRLAGGRALDRLDLVGVPCRPTEPGGDGVDTRVRLGGAIDMDVPLYFGDMSYGSLAGLPNVALARAADQTGTLTGTGEGGLHPDVARCKRITVQWASARFGVSPRTIGLGLGNVIKVGQGAKPGVGGHLPASKVTDVIRRTRRIPTGRDAISPAPHHDIYSIEDLGQRIAALKRMNGGKPVFVKVAATNYSPYIACGVARMDGDGIILDGAGAGTGASPTVMKDHVGLPIEYATAGVDRMLRREGLRDGFSVISAGTVSGAMDAARLTALGADCVSIGTASLIAMGCVMVHKCHVGSCPALLTTPAEDEPKRSVDIDWITDLQVGLVRGWKAELQAIIESMGLRSVRELIGRRDLLQATGPLDQQTAKLFGVEAEPVGRRTPGSPWSARDTGWVQELSGARGTHGGEAQVGSMGSTAAPFAEEPTRILDHLRLDGAQVTRPSIDSYRERVACHLRLVSGLRLAAPIVLPTPAPEVADAVAMGAARMGLLAVSSSPDGLPAVRERTLGDGLRTQRVASRVGIVVDAEADVLLVDEDDEASTDPLELVVADLDDRNSIDGPAIVAIGSGIRGAGDITKLVALGASAAGSSAMVGHALAGTDADDPEAMMARLDDLAFGLMREIRLLLGASGCTALATLHGNRELLRAIDLDDGTREALGVKPAGWG